LNVVIVTTSERIAPHRTHYLGTYQSMDEAKDGVQAILRQEGYTEEFYSSLVNNGRIEFTEEVWS